MDISIAITETTMGRDGSNKEFVEYIIQIQVGKVIWSLRRRFSKFHDLHQALLARYPKTEFPDFPRKQLFHNKDDIAIRREKLQKYLQALVDKPTIVNSWEVQFFLEIRKHTGPMKEKKVLIPLPESDADPTEVTIPWKLLKMEGFEVHFSTEDGAKARPDILQLSPPDWFTSKLSAEYEVRDFYKELELDAKFMRPIPWIDIDPHNYDAILLVGGQAPGIKPYLESKVIQEKIIEFWKLDKVVAAVGYGTILVARSIDESGKSLIYEKNTTTWPKYMEEVVSKVLAWKHGESYRLYPNPCEVELSRQLSSLQQLKFGGFSIKLKGTAFNDSPAFVVEDGNYISARWQGDAYLLAKKLIDRLYKVTTTTDRRTSQSVAADTTTEDTALTNPENDQ